MIARLSIPLGPRTFGGRRRNKIRVYGAPGRKGKVGYD